MKLAWFSVLLSASAVASDAGSWIRLPAYPMWDAEKLDSTYIHQVLPAKRDDAVAQLNRSAIQAIRSDGLEIWAGAGMKCPPRTHPFLLRSVSNGVDFSTLEIRTRGASALVANGALGRNIELQPMPVIVCLSRAPEELYVIYSTAE